ncbi:YicC/YloC family endoribonuclease [Fredinandcohnia quinoae]|uniref:YicC family protein n=1 Tax=Fredinandcohnia quinoae TaxID=2918902 RepID=A0AAW5DXR9_9BACI|nr:YicC/YloC family endoribonuclease [Fredinandcohnia sp. SECRCQ15]MCH1623840.1 YicC family protein [Fredinandcohnia sp. SECRCQ15]
MILSMTGFGQARKEMESYSVTAEIKSINHRFCEINIRMPRQLLVIEDKIKKAIMEHVKRGRVEVFLTIEGEGLVKKSLNIDWELMDHLYHSIKDIQEKYNLTDMITTQQLLSLDDILSIDDVELENNELELIVIEVIQVAVEELKMMREVEGKKLLEEINNYLNQIENNVNAVYQYAPHVVNQYQERLAKRINEYINGEIDDNRILTEVAIFAEKADVSEELTRLHSHISQFKEATYTNDSIGRKLDFIIQEMNREINTIGSKANDSKIAKHVVEMKSLLEKIKEQVQNIE